MDQIGRDRAALIADATPTLDAMVQRFIEGADRYNTFVAAETVRIEGLEGTMGANALEIRFPVDANNRVNYDEATARSIAQARSQEATRLFDDLVDLAFDLEGYPEQVVIYSLLALTAPDRTDLRLNVQMETDDNWAQPFEHYREAGYAPLDSYGRGRLVTFIDGGLFSVDALLRVDR